MEDDDFRILVEAGLAEQFSEANALPQIGDGPSLDAVQFDDLSCRGNRENVRVAQRQRFCDTPGDLQSVGGDVDVLGPLDRVLGLVGDGGELLALEVAHLHEAEVTGCR
jgi:hypothetical protein